MTIVALMKAVSVGLFGFGYVAAQDTEITTYAWIHIVSHVVLYNCRYDLLSAIVSEVQCMLVISCLVAKPPLTVSP